MAFEDFWMSKTEEPTGASLRFSGGQYLNNASISYPTTKLTYSAWVKRGSLSSTQYLFATGVNPTGDTTIALGSSNTLSYGRIDNGPYVNLQITSGVFRDPGAWYHVLLKFDTSGAGSISFYVNGVQQALSTNTLSPGYLFSAFTSFFIGSYYDGASNYSGYLSDNFVVEGQALNPTTFGQFDANGVWVPLDFTTAKANVIAAGGFGTNGFALNFDAANFNSGTLVWADQSGNGNNWAANLNCANGANASAGTDIMVDGPQTNYATYNPLSTFLATVSDGNLTIVNGGTAHYTSTGTMEMSRAADIYYESTAQSFAGANSQVGIGVALPTAVTDQRGDRVGLWNGGGTNSCIPLYQQTTQLPVPPGSVAAGDTMQIAYEGSTGNMWYGVDNVWYNSTGGTTGDPSNKLNPTMSTTLSTVLPWGDVYANVIWNNFGQRPFRYTPPTGFSGLNATTLAAAPVPNGSTGFQAILDTGANILTTAQATFPNGLWWVKDRVNANQGQLVDSVRGAGLAMRTPAGGSEVAYVTPTGNSVAWCWSAPSAFSDSTGTIPVTGSRNTSTGFSIVTYLGTNTPSTYGHGLPAAPDFVITLALDAIGAVDICVWHRYFQSPQTTGDKNMLLSSTSGLTSGSQAYPSPPDSSFVYLDGATGTNKPAGSRFAAYQWCAIPGYSNFGNYTGNNSTDGPFVYTGFKPALVILKSVSTSGNWYQYDNARNTYNPETLVLQASQTSGDTTVNGVDFLSNGFKIRTTNGNVNTSGQTYIYAAFAENPFGGSNVAPVTAR